MIPRIAALICAASIVLSGCESQSQNKKMNAPATISKKEVSSEPKWNYTTNIDKMRGTKTFYALLFSINHPNLNFPYQGGSPLVLGLWKQNDSAAPYPFEPSLTLLNGQFDCSLHCSVAIKFDSNPIIYRDVTEYSCGSNHCLHLGTADKEPYGAESLIPPILRAKVMVVEVPIYRYGSFQYEFHVANLKWSTSNDYQ